MLNHKAIKLILGHCLLIPGALLSILQNSHATEQVDYEKISRQLYPAIEKKIKEKNIVGLSLALVDKGAIVWAEGFGYSDRARKTKISPNTQFRIGSITKLFTALASLQLQDNDRIDIDQPLSAYLERFLMKSRFSDDSPITVRNVLTHHSGMPTDLFKGQWQKTRFTNIVEQLRNEYVSYPPEFVLSYSNIGYSLLGHMIEETTDQSYESYIQEHILQPLSMRHTGFAPEANLTTLSHAFNKDRDKKDLLPIRDIPAMGLYSSAHDLANFVRLFLDRDYSVHQHVLSEASLTEMMEHQNADVELDFDEKIGLAWHLDRAGINDAGAIAEHGGTTMYYSSQIVLAPKYGLGVIVLANTQGSRATVNQIAETILLASINLKRGSHGKNRVAAANETPAADEYMPPLGGDYMTSLGLVSIDPREVELCACSKRKVLDLVPQPDGWFNLQKKSSGKGSTAKQARMTEKFIDGQKVIVIQSEGRTHRFGSSMPEAAIPELWKQRLGDYRIVNSDEDFPVDHVSLLEKNKRLYLGYRMPKLSHKKVETPLAPITDHEAVTVGLGRTRGETVRIKRFDDTRMEYLVFSGLIAEKI